MGCPPLLGSNSCVPPPRGGGILWRYFSFLWAGTEQGGKMGGPPFLWGWGHQPRGAVPICQVTYLKPGGAPLWLERGPTAGLVQVRIPTQVSLACSQEPIKGEAQGPKAPFPRPQQPSMSLTAGQACAFPPPSHQPGRCSLGEKLISEAVAQDLWRT